MKFKTKELDFSEVQTLGDMHTMLHDVFGFPSFYGRNFHALVDCLSSMRFPDEGMTSFFINNDEALLLNCKQLSACEKEVVQHFLQAVENVNERQTFKNRPLLIFLMLSE